MAPGLRTKSSRTSQGQHAPAEKSYNIPGLDFNQALTWKPGKAILVDDLIERLKSLHEQCNQFEEDQVDSRSWTPLAGDLANTHLLGHKDKGVRAWAVSCVLDVLRICAPDAPFLDHQLKVRLSNRLSIHRLPCIRTSSM